MIEDFYHVTDTGELLKPFWWKDSVDKGLGFEKKNIVAITWISGGKKYQKELGDIVHPEVIPGKDGILAFEKNNNRIKKLVVYESDGSLRFGISPPIVSEWSKPEKAFFYYVQFLKNGECECIFDDGHHEYRSKLNVVNGEMSDFRKTRV